MTKLLKTGLPFTVEDVCQRAGVGKTFIYDKRRPKITQMVLDARDASQLDASRKIAESDGELTSAWRDRALNAESEVKRLRAEVRAYEHRISDLTGQLFDPDGNHLAEENARLRKQLDALLVQLTSLRVEASIAQRSLQASRATVARERERTLALVEDNPMQSKKPR